MFGRRRKDAPPLDGSLTRGDVDSYKAALLLHLTSEVQEGQRKLSQQQLVLDEKDIQISDQEQLLEQLREAGQCVRQENAQLALEKNQLEEVVQQLRKGNDIMQSQKEVAAAEETRLRSEVEELKATSKTAAQERGKREEEFKQLVLETERLEVDFARLKGQPNEFKQENETLKAEVEELRKRVDSLEIEAMIRGDTADVLSGLRSLPGGDGSSLTSPIPDETRDQLLALEARVQDITQERDAALAQSLRVRAQETLRYSEAEMSEAVTQAQAFEAEAQYQEASQCLSRRNEEVANLQGKVVELKEMLTKEAADKAKLTDELEESRLDENLLRQDVAELTNRLVATEGVKTPSDPQLPVRSDADASFRALAAEHESTLHMLSAYREQHRALQDMYDSEHRAHATVKERCVQLEEDVTRKVDADSGVDEEVFETASQILARKGRLSRESPIARRDVEERSSEELKKVEEAKKRYEARKALAKQRMELLNLAEGREPAPPSESLQEFTSP